MYVEEIILDGFKSYATRTVISGFDKQFNAITGLNGSGKSNILDAICFVLGISNLAQVRVSNLQELVYKQGQAGVTKASVTIMFNNEQTSSSPVGYEAHKKITVTRQVMIGGKNKYLINGHNAQLSRVQNLFHSVQLNVNNPHFLIMQGRITKVLNMKPAEVLGMIEEAAGTRMFESKKINAQKTIEKKQRKVDEIKKVLTEEITPTLEGLRKERSQYVQWQRNEGEIEKLVRFQIAYRYTDADRTLRESEEAMKKLEEKSVQLQAQEKQLVAEIKALEAEIESTEKEAQLQAGDDFNALEKEVSELSKEMVRVGTAWKHKTEALQSEHDTLKTLLETTTENEKAIEEKMESLLQTVDGVMNAQKAQEEMEQRVAELQQRYQGVSAGVADGEEDANEGEKATLQEQVREAQRIVSTTRSETKKAKLKIKHITKELAEKKKHASGASKELQKLHKEYESAQEKALALQSKLSDDYDEARAEELNAERSKLRQRILELQQQEHRLSAELSNVQFTYSDPHKNFDRSLVHGLVADLMQVSDPKYATALEVVAGSRLYNVVVQDEVTGKQLLDRGKLRRRVTLIPLNKISARTIPAQCKENAESLVGKENVHTALSLVGYKQNVQEAMRYVFGSTFVCASSDIARAVTFDKSVRQKSVTLDGDVFDPSGTLTGGSRPSGGAMLQKLQQLSTIRSELDELKARLLPLDQEYNAIQKQSGAYAKKRREWELAEHAATLLKNRIDQNAAQQHADKIAELEQSLSDAHTAIEELCAKENEWVSKVEHIGERVANASKERDAQLAELDKQVKSAKKELVQLKKKAKMADASEKEIQSEIDELKSEVKLAKEQRVQLEKTISELDSECTTAQQSVEECKQRYQTRNMEFEQRKAEVAAKSKRVAKLRLEYKKVRQSNEQRELHTKKLDNEMKQTVKEAHDAEALVRNMCKRHRWIEQERQFFGKADTDYDFAKKKIAGVNQQIDEMRALQERLSKSINKKVMSMFEKAEAEYQELTGKKSIIEKDKEMIEAAIRELDEKKVLAVGATHERVNKDFGAIFSALLPGANAQLISPEGMSVTDGLEIKVSFNNMFKNLGELSGGQRSLVALSLILALLLFKPAPMYILDEIDAALDLSHTQNIGQMLKNHFTHSQFIIVSLKPGMFQNANVVFRARFVDGVSQVQRTARTLAPK